MLSGAATSEQAERCMDMVHERLATEHGILLCDPPHRSPDPHIQLPLLVYPPGHKENAGIFCHSNSWAIVAECMLGNGNRAHEYYRAYLPARDNDRAEVRQVEPYVYCQFTHGKTSPRFGQSRNPWLTGTASWTYIAVTQHILGLRPVLAGLRIDPCIPATWSGFTVERLFRGKRLTITRDQPRWTPERGEGVACGWRLGRGQRRARNHDEGTDNRRSGPGRRLSRGQEKFAQTLTSLGLGYSFFMTPSRDGRPKGSEAGGRELRSHSLTGWAPVEAQADDS
ncbi:MAG: hypothetical protein IPL70_14095 [Uliginosibacterium sp.]|nr:hypothetical protein [Uliginosibacterium sp.]